MQYLKPSKISNSRLPLLLDILAYNFSTCLLPDVIYVRESTEHTDVEEDYRSENTKIGHF